MITPRGNYCEIAEKVVFNDPSNFTESFFVRSFNAGGLLALVSIDNASSVRSTIDQIGIDAYRFLMALQKISDLSFVFNARIKGWKVL